MSRGTTMSNFLDLEPKDELKVRVLQQALSDVLLRAHREDQVMAGVALIALARCSYELLGKLTSRARTTMVLTIVAFWQGERQGGDDGPVTGPRIIKPH